MNNFLNFFRRIMVDMEVIAGLEFGVRFVSGTELDAAAEGTGAPPAAFGILLSLLFVNVLLVWERKDSE